MEDASLHTRRVKSVYVREPIGDNQSTESVED